MTSVIGISGSYGGFNLGDEAILTSVIHEFRRTLGDCELVVFSRDAEHTRRHHNVERVVSHVDSVREEIIPEIERLDMLLLGGGGILFDREAEIYLREPRLAQQRGIPTATFAIGVGPLERASERRAVAEVLNGMERVTVRELAAKRILEQVGVDRDVVVTADPALLLQAEPFADDMLRAEGIRKDGRLVAMSVREPGPAAEGLDDVAYHALLATAADFLADRIDAQIVFVPLERGDVQQSHKVTGEMAFADRVSILRGEYTPQQLIGLMRHADIAVGMRLHFLIFAALADTPILALPYASKVIDFLEQLEVPKPQLIQRESAGALLSYIDKSWDHRAEHQRHIRERIGALKERSALTVGLCLDVMGVKQPGPRSAFTRTAG